ncbi:hypothetical protein Btru_028344 [Bulinus truncatus]|nr:hypothetical protein Btru_028344 [Bulinus truncatus]
MLGGISENKKKVMEKRTLSMDNDLVLSEESDFDSEIDEDDFLVSKKIHPLLQEDIELLQSIFPQSCLSARMLPGLCEMDLKMSFPTSHLNEFIMKAWGLTPGLPITLHLTLDSESYMSSNAKYTVDVFQTNSALKTGATIQLKNITQAFCVRRQQSLTKEMKLHSVETCNDNNSLLNDSRPKSPPAAESEFSKNFPSLDYGFLVQLYIYVQERLMTLNNYCPICDHLHPSTKENVMLKLVVCNNPLCIFSSQTLGVMSDVTPLLKTQPEVAQLLIHLTAAAINSKRQEIILFPFPTIVHSEKVTELTKKDSDLLKTIISLIPNVRDMAVFSED